MGGVGGHLNHLYDDRSMTFDKMMDIIDAASQGKLQAEEKATKGVWGIPRQLEAMKDVCITAICFGEWLNTH